MYGNYNSEYYIVQDVWLMKNPANKTRQPMLFRRLGALYGVTGGRGVDFIEEKVSRRL